MNPEVHMKGFPTTAVLVCVAAAGSERVLGCSGAWVLRFGPEHLST